MGTLALSALAFIISLGLGLNHELEMDQENFRAALATHNRTFLFEPPIAVHYTQFRDRQIPDVEQGFGMMPRTLTHGDVSVTWHDHLYLTADQDRVSKPMTVINVNGMTRQFRDEDFETLPPGPLITKVNRQFTGNGVVAQRNSKASTTNTGSNQSTTVTLKDGSEITGAVNSNVNWNW